MKKVCPIVTPRPSTPFLQQKKESARLPLPSKSRLVYELHCCRASLLPFLPPMQMKLSTSSSPPPPAALGKLLSQLENSLALETGGGGRAMPSGFWAWGKEGGRKQGRPAVG